MKEIKLAYSDLYNAGDLMNIDIVEKLSGAKVIRSKTYCAEMTAIGGALVGLQFEKKISKRIIQLFLKCIYGNKKISIWGTGFLHDYNDNKLYRNNLDVCALRGKKTKERLERYTGKTYNVPLADAGLIIDQLIEDTPAKIYKIGVIPHMWHQEESAFLKLKNMDGVHVINIRQTPQQVAYEIAQCEAILSSSLHGLIFADGLYVPNMHILGDRELRGGNFKFEDYYSSFDLEDNPCKLSEHIPSYEEIINSYKITKEQVDKKKIELLNSFPKF